MIKTLLFPGGFKPFHDGHLSILKRYINNIDKIYIIISKKDRAGISANSTLSFLENIKSALISKYNVDFQIIISDSPSPIMQCYRIVGNSQDNEIFCLVASSKDDDKRVENFNKDWEINGKYYKGIQKVFRIETEQMPLLYERPDKFNNSSISSTVVRSDINEGLYNLFITSYQNMLNENIVSEESLSTYYKELKKLLVIDEKDIKKLKSIENNL